MKIGGKILLWCVLVLVHKLTAAASWCHLASASGSPNKNFHLDLDSPAILSGWQTVGFVNEYCTSGIQGSGGAQVLVSLYGSTVERDGTATVGGVTYSRFKIDYLNLQYQVVGRFYFVIRFRYFTGSGGSYGPWKPVHGPGKESIKYNDGLLDPGNNPAMRFQVQMRVIEISKGINPSGNNTLTTPYIRIHPYHVLPAPVSGPTPTADLVMQLSVSGSSLQTCITPNLHVDLGDVYPWSIPTPTESGAGTSFDLQFQNCPPGINGISYQLQSIPLQGTLNNGVLPLQVISTAAGVSVQVRNSDNTPVVFNQNIPLTAYNPAPPKKSYSVPMNARIVKTGGTIGNGTVHAGMRVLLTYHF